MRYPPATCAPWRKLCFAALCFGLSACGGTDSVFIDDAPHVALSGPTACDVYCGLMATHCTRGFVQYDNNDACLTQCQGFAVNADPNNTAGNTLQCRMVYALTAKRHERKQAFCDNAGPTGGNDCQP